MILSGGVFIRIGYTLREQLQQFSINLTKDNFQLSYNPSMSLPPTPNRFRIERGKKKLTRDKGNILYDHSVRIL